MSKFRMIAGVSCLAVMSMCGMSIEGDENPAGAGEPSKPVDPTETEESEQAIADAAKVLDNADSAQASIVDQDNDVGGESSGEDDLDSDFENGENLDD